MTDDTRHFSVDDKHTLRDNEFGVVARAVRTVGSRYLLVATKEEAMKAKEPTIVPDELLPPDLDRRAWRANGPCVKGAVFGRVAKRDDRPITTSPIISIEGTDGTVYPVGRTREEYLLQEETAAGKTPAILACTR